MALKIGTCSWANRSLISSGWYPKDIKTKEQRLEFYSSSFNTVELDSSFYTIPDVTDVYRWAVNSTRGFVFNVKSYGLFTFHSVPKSGLPSWVLNEIGDRLKDGKVNFKAIPKSIRLELWRQFSDAIMPLHKLGKLGYVLFQIPPWASYSNRMIYYIDRVMEEAGPFKIAFEVRNSSWLNKDNRGPFLDHLKKHNISYVMTDLPPHMGFRSEPIRTATWGSVIRLHGRNVEAWKNKQTSTDEKFRYLYSQKELREWMDPISELYDKSRDLFIMFNNCWNDYSVRNAVTMQNLLGIPSGRSNQRELDLDR